MRRAAVVAALVVSGVACRESAAERPPPAAPPERAASLVVAPVDAACGTPAVDGVLSPGEWDGAVSVRFAAVLPELTNGPDAVVPAEVRALSDGSRLYVSFRLAADTSQFAQSHSVSLDVDGDGGTSPGDDELGFSWGRYDPYHFADTVRWACVVDQQPAICSSLDTEPVPGMPLGTSDGGAAISFGEAETTVELWHPYTGADPRDVLRAAGERIAMQFSIRLVTVCDVDVNDWPTSARCFGDTSFPPYGFRPFVLGCGGPPPEEEIVEVRIDVKFGDPVPTIPLGSSGTTAVVVRGSDRFDAANVDPASVWFAGAPVEKREGGGLHARVEDVDGDGYDDFVAHFVTATLQLGPDAREASIAGTTADGRRFHGTDAVRVTVPVP